MDRVESCGRYDFEFDNIYINSLVTYIPFQSFRVDITVAAAEEVTTDPSRRFLDKHHQPSP